MSLSWKRAGVPPVAADLGATGIRLLQLATDDATMLATAAEHPIATEAQFNLDMHLAASSQAIASIRDNKCWSGRKIIVSMPAPLVSMACVRLESDEDPTFVAQSRFPELADDLSIRVVDLPAAGRAPRSGRDVLLLAMSKAAVLQYVEMLHEHRFEVAGVYSPASMMVRAFAHLNRRERDADSATLYMDLDHHGTTVAIGHGQQLAMARRINAAVALEVAPPRSRSETASPVAVATGQLDQNIVATLNRRQDGTPPSIANIQDTPNSSDSHNTSPIDEIVDELQMCMRHHRSLFEHVDFGRVVFTGAGAAQDGPCRHLARALGMPAVVGDPVGQWNCQQTHVDLTDWCRQIRPQWTIAAGLTCTADGIHPS